MSSDAELRRTVRRALFDRLPGSRHLHLVEALSFPAGTVVHIYRPQHT